MKKVSVNEKPLLGIIGGMGTQATACFYEKLHSLQDVTKEQEYLDILLYSIPSTPDRTAYITGQSGESPLRHLIHAAKTLEAAGATCIAIPCITSHFFYDDLIKAVGVPILNMLDETAGFAAEKGIKKVNLLATDGTIKGRAFHSAFEKHGIKVTVPPEEEQRKLMTAIYDIKRGLKVPPDTFNSITEGTVVLGCTELCIVTEESENVINTLDVLARASLESCYR